MSDATTVANEATQAETVQSEERDFASGFDNAQGAQPSPEAKKDEKAEVVPEEPKTEAATEVKTETVPAEKPALIAGLTEEEWAARVAKGVNPVAAELRDSIRKNFSQIGEINRTVQELSRKLSAGGSNAYARKITSEALKRVSEELPGLGEALAADLSAIFDSPAQAAAEEKAKQEAEDKGQKFDPAVFFEKFYAEKIGPALEQLETRANEKAELRIVKSVHRDFDAVVKSEEFSSWLGTLSPERRKEVRESDDGLVAADAVTEFKAWHEQAKKKKETNQKRLEQATTPKGDKSQTSLPVQDEDADFNRGFKTADKKYAR